MGRKKRASPTDADGIETSKKQKAEESYLVKKYRADKQYPAMNAFVKYTKAHRMSDAKYLRWHKGVTPEKPFVFSTRVGGTDLGWGRGKTREAAMDASCRAAFALVSAHGYNQFTVDEDCLAVEPQDILPPPPPPPPPPFGMAPPLPPGMPPLLPSGVPPPLPVVPDSDLIPQARVMSQALPVASSLSTATTTQAEAISLTLTTHDSNKKKLKGGLTLLFEADNDSPNDLCMEERRALLPRYQKLLGKAAIRS
jgi:hypothetical protein